MIVVSDNLTTGEISFILRVIIQILSYGGIFLIGLIIFGSVPHIAPRETHDLLNRLVGQSTATTNTLIWLAKRVFRKKRDRASSALALALSLSATYGLLVTLTDVGLIGIRSCTIPGSSFQDFPASVKSDGDALAVVSSNMADGLDPHTVKSYRCDTAYMNSSADGTSTNTSLCTAWRTSTYGDPSNFVDLNSTDSDVLMLRNLGSLNGTSEVDTYLIGAAGQTVLSPTIVRGLAVIPHETGVVMIVGVPQLSEEQKVDIPKTLALEVEMGCMPLGMFGEQSMDPVIIGGTEGNTEFFVPDEIYLSERLQQYAGPDILRDPLMRAADGVRNVMHGYFNSSEGTATNRGAGLGWGSLENSVWTWSPPNASYDSAMSFLDECTVQIEGLLNMSSVSDICSLNRLTGSFHRNQSAFQGYSEMVCATAVQVNMVSATLTMNGDGDLNSDFTRLPSDLNNIQASHSFQVAPSDFTNPNLSSMDVWSHTDRYTLSDNSAGALQHYIDQVYNGFTPATNLMWGLGSSGEVFTTVGSAPLGPRATVLLDTLNSTYFSANFSVSQVTRWGGGICASYLLQSIGYNGWAARGSQGFTVVRTGGQPATCYDARYIAALLPLFLVALIVTCWAIVISFTSGIHDAQRLQNLYGGLSPTTDLPFPGKVPEYTYLTWENDPEPHLIPAVEKMSIVDAESEALVSKEESEETYLELPSDPAEPPIMLNKLENAAKS